MSPCNMQLDYVNIRHFHVDMTQAVDMQPYYVNIIMVRVSIQMHKVMNVVMLHVTC